MSDGTRVPRECGSRVSGVDPGGYHAVRLGYPAELFRLIVDRTGSESLGAILEIGGAAPRSC